jgi:type VI secretion system protein ImpK
MPAPKAAQAASRYALSHWPRRAIWSAVAGIVGASLVLYMLGTRLQDDETRDAIAAVMKAARQKAAQAPGTAAAPAGSTAPAVPAAVAQLTAALAGLPVDVSQKSGAILLALRDGQQYAPGSTLPSGQVAALLQKIAAALDRQPGAILVIGHADATPPREGSNAELSAARARAAARTMAKALADPKRLATEGRSDAEPIAPNDTEANRAKNRRVAIQLKTAN